MKIDLHCHSYYSSDGLSSPKDLLKEALKKGLDGIALTDHETTSGWKEAQKAAKELNAFLVLGEEIKVKNKGKKLGDILALFIKEEIKSREITEAVKEIKEQGGIVIVAHPFHFLANFEDDLEKYLHLIDGVEVFNARTIFDLDNEKALKFAQKHNLAQVGGSDSHFPKTVGDAYTLAEAKNLEEFKMAILERKTKGEGKKSCILNLIFPSLGRSRHLFKKP